MGLWCGLPGRTGNKPEVSFLLNALSGLPPEANGLIFGNLGKKPYGSGDGFPEGYPPAFFWDKPPRKFPVSRWAYTVLIREAAEKRRPR